MYAGRDQHAAAAEHAGMSNLRVAARSDVTTHPRGLMSSAKDQGGATEGAVGIDGEDCQCGMNRPCLASQVNNFTGPSIGIPEAHACRLQATHCRSVHDAAIASVDLEWNQLNADLQTLLEQERPPRPTRTHANHPSRRTCTPPNRSSEWLARIATPLSDGSFTVHSHARPLRCPASHRFAHHGQC
jgi:hypothetical protein